LLTVLALFSTADRGSNDAITWVVAAGVFLGLALVASYGRRSLKWRLGDVSALGTTVPQEITLL
jgi:hypothetical protein